MGIKTILLISISVIFTAVLALKLDVVTKISNFRKSRNPATSPVVLEYWGLGDKFDVSAIMFDGFKKSNPQVSLKYDQKSYKNLLEYKDFIFTRLKEGTAADLLLVHVTWVPEIAKYLVPSSSVSEKDISDKFFKTAADFCVTKGAVYCVPPLYDGLALLYNKDAFAREGISDPPRTWEEFKMDAEKLTKKDASDKIYFSGAAIGLSENIPFSSDILGLMLSQSDIKIPADLQEQPAVDVLSFYTSFYKTSKVWDESQENSLKSFAEGKVAMVFAPSWALIDIVNQSPLLRFGVAAVPQIPIEGGSGITNVNWASYWVFVVPKNSANASIAWNFINFATSSEQEINQYNAQKKYRPFGQVYSLKELTGDISKSEILRPFIEGSETATTNLIADQSGNDSFAGSIKDAITSVAKGGNASSAMATAKSEIESLLNPKPR